MEGDTQITLNLLHILAIIGSFVGILMSIFFFFNKSAKNRANIYLAVLTFIYSSYFIPTLLYWLGILEVLPHFIHLHIFLNPIWGPFLYFYVSACTRDNFKIRRIDYLHFVPFLLQAIYIFPFLSSSGAEKLEAFFIFQTTNKFNVEGFQLIALIKTILATLYFVFCIKLVYDYKGYLPKTTSNIDTTFHRWLALYCFSLLLPVASISVFIFTTLQWTAYAIMFTGLFISIIFTQIVALAKPELFHAFPNLIPSEEHIKEEQQKYKNSNLEDDQKEKYISRLKNFMQKEKPYQAPELTLAQLSDQVNIPSYYLSQVINEKLDCNFLDFINGYRVEETKAKLTDAKFEHYTILAIAYEAGFNSKSTFYAAFKKWTGTTPSKFRKSLQIT